MDKILITYFYQLRNLSTNIIPVSTAVWDPKWFHDFKGHSHVYIDKNGIMNGLRYSPLTPGKSCDGLCTGRPCKYNPKDCQFLSNYRAQLDNIDFNQFISDMDKLMEDYKLATSIENPLIALVVYETPDNPCSERSQLQSWITSHGIICEEFDPCQIYKYRSK